MISVAGNHEETYSSHVGLLDRGHGCGHDPERELARCQESLQHHRCGRGCTAGEPRHRRGCQVRIGASGHVQGVCRGGRLRPGWCSGPPGLPWCSWKHEVPDGVPRTGRIHSRHGCRHETPASSSSKEDSPAQICDGLVSTRTAILLLWDTNEQSTPNFRSPDGIGWQGTYLNHAPGNRGICTPWGGTAGTEESNTGGATGMLKCEAGASVNNQVCSKQSAHHARGMSVYAGVLKFKRSSCKNGTCSVFKVPP
jgi:hypothetical protein